MGRRLGLQELGPRVTEPKGVQGARDHWGWGQASDPDPSCTVRRTRRRGPRVASPRRGTGSPRPRVLGYHSESTPLHPRYKRALRDLPALSEPHSHEPPSSKEHFDRRVCTCRENRELPVGPLGVQAQREPWTTPETPYHPLPSSYTRERPHYLPTSSVGGDGNENLPPVPGSWTEPRLSVRLGLSSLSVYETGRGAGVKKTGADGRTTRRF